METSEQSVEAYLDQVTSLPPGPMVLPRLLLLLNKPEANSQELVDVISCDPSLTAAVLRLCNSAFFAGATPAASILEAVVRLGMDRVYELVVAVMGERVLRPAQKGYGLEPGELWRHSVATALATRCMARDVGLDQNVAFTAAILHDLGKIVLAEALQTSYAKLMKQLGVETAAFLESEAKVLGVQHAEIGGALLRRWRFPDELVAAVWSHHNPGAALGHETLTSVVYLGNMVAHFMGFSYGHQALALRGRAEALELAGLSARDLPRYMIETFERLNELEAMVRIRT